MWRWGGIGRGSAALAVAWLLMALLAGASGCAQRPPGITAPDVRLMRVEAIAKTAATGPGERVRIEMRLQNYNEVALRLVGLRFALFLDGVLFANGTSEKHVALPRFGEALTVVEAPALDLGIWRLLDTPGAAERFEYRIRGTFFREIAEGAGGREPLRFEQKGRLLGTGTGY